MSILHSYGAMPGLSHGRHGWSPFFFRTILVLAAILGVATQDVVSHSHRHTSPGWQSEFMQHAQRDVPAKRGPPDTDDKVPLVITNQCDSTIWPGLATQAGTGPGTGGFELASGKSKKLWVASNWQGRIWGRTNCTVNGESCACQTGDCFAKLDGEFSVSYMPRSRCVNAFTNTYIGSCPSYAGRV